MAKYKTSFSPQFVMLDTFEHSSQVCSF